MRLLRFGTALFITALVASGQSFEAGLHGGAMRISNADIGTLTVGGTDRITLKNGWRFGARMTINQFAFFGHELGYAYNRTAFVLPDQKAGTAMHQGFYNFLAYATPEGSKIRPFATGGIHFSNTIYPGSTVTQGGGSNKLGVNYGGGLKIRISPKYLIRFDVRQYLQGKPFDFPGQSGKLKLLEISTGFSFHL
jgi:hypothetical protein